MPKTTRKAANSSSDSDFAGKQRSLRGSSLHKEPANTDTKRMILAHTSREVRYGILRMLADKQWEKVKNILTNRDHKWQILLENDDDVLFRELSMAMSHVGLGEIKIAKRCLERILRLSPEEGRAQLLYAYINLTENNSEQAIMRYVMLLDRKEFQPLVKNILTAVKSTNSLYKLTLNKPLNFFYMHYKRTLTDAFYYYSRNLFRTFAHRKFRKIALGIGLLVIIMLGLSLLIPSFKPSMQHLLTSSRTWLVNQAYFLRLKQDRETVSDIDALNLAEVGLAQRTSTQGTEFSYYKAQFTQLKVAIKTSATQPNAINEAFVIYNDVMMTEPSIPIRQRFEILKAFIPKPSLQSFENSLALDQILEQPLRYKDTYWKWQGEISTLRKLDNSSKQNPQSSQSSQSLLSQQVTDLANHNNIVFSFVIRNKTGGDELLEVFFQAETVFPREGETYEILMQFITLNPRYRPFMQGIAMQRLR
ncbi:hypothetical protein COTS27_01272 [Spirochaetota bacterium]|nr:hypothetical protein COTS27_01272 [Spirochaetota bacterium]